MTHISISAELCERPATPFLPGITIIQTKLVRVKCVQAEAIKKATINTGFVSSHRGPYFSTRVGLDDAPFKVQCISQHKTVPEG